MSSKSGLPAGVRLWIMLMSQGISRFFGGGGVGLVSDYVMPSPIPFSCPLPLIGFPNPQRPFRNGNLCVSRERPTLEFHRVDSCRVHRGRHHDCGRIFAARSCTSGSVRSILPHRSLANASPRIIHINGNNPATIAVGATYADLGATIVSPAADLNLGLTLLVDNATSTDGTAKIATTAPGSHTITYLVTDSAGLTGLATRTVIVAAPANGNFLSTPATTVAATSSE